MKKKKRAFTFTEILIATMLIAVSATMALSIFNTAHDTNRLANDTSFLALVQVNIFEDIQSRIDAGESLPNSYEVETEADRFLIRTQVAIEQDRSTTGKVYYFVHLTSRIGGTKVRKLSTTVLMTQQTGALYDNYF